MSEIAAFIDAQYRRIEEKAREASARSATWHVNGTWHLEGVEHRMVGEEEAFCHPHNVEHIALHDPAYVLADVESKRRILARHAQCGTGWGYCDDGGHDFGDRGCGDLLDLATPFSGEPGYKAEEWAV